MKIIRMMCPSSKWNAKCPYSMNPEYIVVHNTANDAAARAEIQYMISNNRSTSFHYAIDNNEIVQGIEENRNAWHAGDGARGNGNRKGLSIEICYSRSGGNRFNEAEKLAAKFIAYKLKEKGWGIDKVKKHQDFSGKYCPHRTLDNGWERFLNMIRAEMGEAQVPTQPVQNELYKVKIMTKALRIRQAPNTNSTIMGKVYENEIYTIVEESGNWGKLKSGAGWICLDYTSKNLNSNTTPSPRFKLGRYVVTSTIGLNVRKVPGGAKVKGYPYGQQFDVHEVRGDWGHTPSGWVSLNYARLIKER